MECCALKVVGDGVPDAMQSCEEFSDLSNRDTPIRGYLHLSTVPGADCLILTHGAGANCQSVLLKTLAEAFCNAGLTVLRCDLPFRQTRPHGPPLRGGAERDQEGLRAAVESMRRYNGGRILLGGHSYGGRQASVLAANHVGLVEGLLLLSYPLHPPQRPAELRTKHFPNLRTASLFIHGERDGFGSIAEMQSALKLIPASTQLIPVPAAGHELMTSRNRQDLSHQIVQMFISFSS